MWDERISLVRAFADAITDRDVEWALELCHPEVEFFSLMAQLEARPYRGYAGIRKYFNDVDATWGEWRVEVEQLLSAPDGRRDRHVHTHARQVERTPIHTATRKPVGVQGQQALARHAVPGPAEAVRALDKG
jgi:ketosteroid isomerase-like protein